MLTILDTIGEYFLVNIVKMGENLKGIEEFLNCYASLGKK